MCSKGSKAGDSMNVNEIQLREKPTHGSVKRVSKIEADWMFMKLGGIAGLRKFKSLKRDGDDFKTKLFEDQPELMIEFMDFQERLGEYQTIMLATGWDLQEMIDFEVGSEDEISEEDYQTLLKRCIAALGGTAADFFGTSPTDSLSQENETKPEENPKS